MSNGLTVVDVPAQPIADPGQLREVLARIEEHCNMVLPVENAGYIPAGYQVSLRSVLLVEDRDTYTDRQFCKPGEAALSKVGIMRILQSAGGSVVETRRTDGRDNPNYWDYSARVNVPGPDGLPRQFVASKEIDLTDGSALAESAKSPAHLRKMREHGCAMAESKAINRAVRLALSLPQKLTRDELHRPFVTLTLVPALDMTDPEVRRMVAAKALGLERLLFGAGRPPSPETMTLEADTNPAPPALTAGVTDVDPWDADAGAAAAGQSTPAAAGPPYSAEQLADVDGLRRAYLDRVNELCAALYDARGDKAAVDIARAVGGVARAVGGVDLLTAELSAVARVGQALAALRQSV